MVHLLPIFSLLLAFELQQASFHMYIGPPMYVNHPRGRGGGGDKKHHLGHEVTRSPGHKGKAPHRHRLHTTLRPPTCGGALRALSIPPTCKIGEAVASHIINPIHFSVLL